MKLLVVLASLLVAAVSAASDPISNLPKCSQECVKKYTVGTEIAGCKQLQIGCICKNEQFLDGIACCLDKACDSAGKDAAVKFAKQLCGAAGVTVPDQVVCKSSASTSSSFASSSTSASTGTTSTGAAKAASTSSEASSTTGSSAAVPTEAVGGLIGALLAAIVAL